MLKKCFIFGVSIFVLLYSCVFAQNVEYKNEQTNYSLVIEDDAGLLNETEIDQLFSDMLPLTQYGNIVFKSISANNTSTENYAASYYHQKFGSRSGSLFFIDMANRMIYIFSDGSNYAIITKTKANIITDNIYRYASKQDYYECASNAYQQMDTLLAGGKILEPMRYISSGFVAIISALLINFILVMIHSKAKVAKADEVLKNCKISFIINSVRGVKIGDHRVYSPQSDGGSSSSGGSGFSSGGGHSSGGGGGHSSGGGGGHRF